MWPTIGVFGRCDDWEDWVYCAIPPNHDAPGVLLAGPGFFAVMRYTLIDRIVELVPGEKIVAVKVLSLAEEYLDDHFPLFPVMPGVLMLESMAQAGAWLVRASEDFAHSRVLLKEARNVKYADFVEPGQMLTVTAKIIDQDERETRLKTQGTVDGRLAVSGRLTLERYNEADAAPHNAPLDDYTRNWARELFLAIYPESLRPTTT